MSELQEIEIDSVMKDIKKNCFDFPKEMCCIYSNENVKLGVSKSHILHPYLPVALIL